MTTLFGTTSTDVFAVALATVGSDEHVFLERRALLPRDVELSARGLRAQAKYSLGSTMRPAIALAATVSGLAR